LKDFCGVYIRSVKVVFISEVMYFDFMLLGGENDYRVFLSALAIMAKLFLRFVCIDYIVRVSSWVLCLGYGIFWR